MIDRSLINGEKLIDLILDDCAGNINRWWRLVEFVMDYRPPHPRPDTKLTRCSIKCGESFLRDLGRGVFIWDIHYGQASEFHTPEGALLALMKAPVPPFLLNDKVWPKTAPDIDRDVDKLAKIRRSYLDLTMGGWSHTKTINHLYQEIVAYAAMHADGDIPKVIGQIMPAQPSKTC